MTRRRWIILAFLAIVLTLGSEMILQPSRGIKGCVRIVNQNDFPLENLVARYGGSNVALGQLNAGESINVRFDAGPPGPLTIDFDQKGVALNGFTIRDYDPRQNRLDGFKVCLTVKNNLVERSVEDDETVTAMQALFGRLKDWIKRDLQATTP